MRIKPMFTLYKKEIMDLLRDKKTIIVMILVPILLYPTMMLISLFIMQGIAKDSVEKEYRIAMVESDLKNDVEDVISKGAKEQKYHFKFLSYKTAEEAKEALLAKEADLVVVSDSSDMDESTRQIFSDRLFQIKIYNLSASTNSSNAYANVRDVLNRYSDTVRKRALENRFENAEAIITPIKISAESISTSEENAGSLIGTALPFILILAILTGAIYPAIDATAGERERGTLETIMTLPVRKSEIMVSKFLSVSSIAIFTALLNILSMSAMMVYLYKTMDLSGALTNSFEFSRFIPAIVSLLICLPIFAMFTSALCLCVCIFAKSFKEANNISSPIMIVFMFAAMVSILPNVELTEKTALIPISNISLLIKSVFSLDYDVRLVALVLFSNLFYCVLMIVFMSTLFSSEDVLFGESSGGIHLFERRANLRKGTMPGVADLLLVFSALMLLVIYLGSLASLKVGFYSSLVIQLMILLIPLLYAIYIRCDLKKLYFIRAPRVLQLLAVILIWAGAFSVNQVLATCLSKIIPSMETSSDLLTESILSGGFIPALIIVGITPAICEEAAFRGFLFGSLKHRTKVWIAVLISAALFGLYHMNFLQFFTGLFMGCFMAYMTYKSESIFPSVLFHMLNNSLSVIATFYPKMIETVPVLGEGSLKITDLILLAVVGSLLAAAGVFLFHLGSRIPVHSHENEAK